MRRAPTECLVRRLLYLFLFLYIIHEERLVDVNERIDKQSMTAAAFEQAGGSYERADGAV
jgi:hypothetical protein